jgi:uncharacterized protein (TIGR03084 family)
VGDVAEPVGGSAGGAQRVDDVRAETDDLLPFLVGLDEAGWRQATPAEGWTIADQVAHLAYFDGTAVLATTDPSGFAAHVKEVLAAPNPGDVSSAAGAGKTGAELLQWFTDERDRMLEVFRPLDPKARVPWYGPPMAATSFATARLMETWAHGQDIVDTLGATRRPTDRLRHVAHIGVRARPFSYVANRRTAPDAPVRVVLDAPSGGTWSWNDEAGDDNVVRGPALDFCLVVTQRRHVADTALVTEGPLAAEWIAIAQAFAGPPGKGRKPGQFAS